MTFYLDRALTESPVLLRSEALDALDGVTHGFATRIGGFDFAWDAARRRDDLRRLAEHLGGEDDSVRHATQVHGKQVLLVDGSQTVDEVARHEADALVCNTPGLLVGVLTADCVPVLLADATAGVVAAAHAGWRGLVGGVLEQTVAAMLALGAQRSRLRAAVGPCIGADAYEVGEEVAGAFRQLEGVVRQAATGRPHVDLERAAAALLESAGVPQRALAKRCTYDEVSLFHSYRRDGASAGRQLSVIGLRSAPL